MFLIIPLFIVALVVLHAPQLLFGIALTVLVPDWRH